MAEIRPRVGVVVLNWNNVEDTLDCLASLVASSYPTMSVILVDNHSSEDPSALVATRFPTVHIARQSRNLGYSGGNNAGIVWALGRDADYVLLLNNDAVAGADMIERLVEVGERHPDAGFVTPKILISGTDQVYWDGGTVDWSTGDVSHDSSSLVEHDRVRESGWSNACAPLVRAKTIREIGLMDDELFLYYEDLDWSERGSKVGWRHLVALDGTCWHKVSRSSGGVTTPLARYYYARNRYRVLKRHSPGYKSFLGVMRYARRLIEDYHWHRAEVSARRAILHGTLDLIQGRWGERSQRGSILMVVADAIAYAAATTAFVLSRIWKAAPGRKRRLRD